jgi:hypothetical protein
MAKSPRLPSSGPISLAQFLAYTGWEKPNAAAADGMRTALSFYQAKVPRNILMAQVDRASLNPAQSRKSSPFAPKTIHGPVIKLVELMQAIDFTQAVRRYTAQRNERYKQVRRNDESATEEPTGNWFTHLSTRVETLGLPSNQTREYVYVVQSPVEGLKSTVADAFTWLRMRPGETTADKYFHGGAMQFFVWDPADFFKLA